MRVFSGPAGGLGSPSTDTGRSGSLRRSESRRGGHAGPPATCRQEVVKENLRERCTRAAAGRRPKPLADAAEKGLRGSRMAARHRTLDILACAGNAPWSWRPCRPSSVHPRAVDGAARRRRGILWRRDGPGRRVGRRPPCRTRRRPAARSRRRAAHPCRDHAEARDCIHYLFWNRHRRRYPQFRAKGLCVSPGVVEAGCKQIGARLQRAGMRRPSPGPTPSSPCAAASSAADASTTAGSDEPQMPPDAHLTTMSCAHRVRSR